MRSRIVSAWESARGRKTLDKDRLLTALAPYLSADESEAVIQAGYKTGESYERLYVSPINKSI